MCVCVCVFVCLCVCVRERERERESFCVCVICIFIKVLANKYPQGVDLVIEHVGGQLFQTALQHLKPKV